MKRLSRPTDYGFGQSTCVGIGGDPIPGSTSSTSQTVPGKIRRLKRRDRWMAGSARKEEAAAYIKDRIRSRLLKHIGCYRAESSVWATLTPSLPVVKVLPDENSAALEAAGVKTVAAADIGRR